MKDLLPLLYAMAAFLVLPLVTFAMVVIAVKVFGNGVAHHTRHLPARQRPLPDKEVQEAPNSREPPLHATAGQPPACECAVNARTSLTVTRRQLSICSLSQKLTSAAISRP